MRCTPDQVVIVSGVQEALGLVARLLVDPGDLVCLEDPGYPGAARVFETAGATIVPVPVDDEGMKVPPLRARAARVAYVTPAHQFPLGTSMTVARRLRLLDWARASGCTIVEDDYDSEYRYAGKPLPALQGLDRHGVVLFTGSFSKVLCPSLRLGYLVVPEDVIDPLAALLSVEGRHAPRLDQAILCDFIDEGHFFRHLRAMRERLRRATRGASRRWPASAGRGCSTLSPIEAGLQTPAILSVAATGEAVARAAAARAVEVTPLSRYARRPMDFEGLLLGFGAVDARRDRAGRRRARRRAAGAMSRALAVRNGLEPSAVRALPA